MKWLGLFLLLSTQVLAQVLNPYVTKRADLTPVCDNTLLEVPNLPPVRDQGTYGTCYSHSSLLMLEHLRCAKTSSPQNCYKESGSVLHLARFQHGADNKIGMGGDPITVLNNFSNKLTLAKEKCAKYEDWVKLDKLYKKERGASKLTNDLSEKDYFFYVSEQLKNNASVEMKNCFAKEILDAGVQHNLNDILSILNNGKNKSWQELRYELLIPNDCHNQKVTYPEYTQLTYPRHDELREYAGFRNFAYQLLSQGIPFEASFSVYKSNDGKRSNHTAAIVGQREVCNLQSCRLQFKIQNSYGKSWQELNDNGWVDAENLVNLMDLQTLGFSAIIPKGKTIDTKKASPYYTASPFNASSPKDKQCWKAPRNPRYITEETKSIRSPGQSTPGVSVVTPSIPTPAPAPLPAPIPPRKGIYICRGPDGTEVTDYPKVGMDCVEKKF